MAHGQSGFPSQDPRQGRVARLISGLVVLAGMVASVVLPHIAVVAATVYPGRSLIPATNFFLHANPNASGFADATSVSAAGLGIVVSYFGLAFQEIGLILGAATFWVLMVAEVGRWTRRILVAAGVFMTLGAATVVLGYQLLNAANVPSLLGLAWLPTLIAGLVMVIGGVRAKRRLVSTWYWERPEVVQP